MKDAVTSRESEYVGLALYERVSSFESVRVEDCCGDVELVFWGEYVDDLVNDLSFDCVVVPLSDSDSDDDAVTDLLSLNSSVVERDIEYV